METSKIVSFTEYDKKAYLSHNMLMENFGERLKQARKAKNLSQSELAELCGWDNNVRISKYETGGQMPRPDGMIKLATVLEVDPTWLLKGESIGENGTQYNIVNKPDHGAVATSFSEFAEAMASKFIDQHVGPGFNDLPTQQKLEFIRLIARIFDKPESGKLTTDKIAELLDIK